MGRLLGRMRMRAALGMLSAAVSAVAVPAGAAGQDREEVIADPELAAEPAPSARDADDEVIADPELGEPSARGGDLDWGAAFQGSVPSVESVPAAPDGDDDPLANTGLAKIELLGQFGADLHHEGELEDAYETRLRFGGEIEFRRSRRLRLVVGSRVDFFWGVPGQGDSIITTPVKGRPMQRALDQDRFEVDIIPTAAYADMSVFDGFHLRVGEQVVSLGRMDFYSPNDVLVIYDLRPQPRLDPAAAKLAQPAVRIDWDITTALTLQAAYIPWFSPHLTRPNRDKYVAAVTGGKASAQLPDGGAAYIDPSFQTKQSEENLRFVGPPPDFGTPQVAARLVLRGRAFDVALSAGSALEKVPAVYLTPFAAEIAAKGLDANAWSQATNDLAPRLISNPTTRVADVEFHRYAMVGGDLGFDVGPLSVGFEGGYSPSRHLYAATKDGKSVPQPDVSREITDPCLSPDQQGCKLGPDEKSRPSNVGDGRIRKGVAVVQGAIHVEWVKGTDLILGGEAFWLNALRLPYDRTRDWWGFVPDTGAFIGGTANGRYLLNDGQWCFEGTVIGTVGPSFVFVPRIELRAREGLFVDVGAQIFEGSAPGYRDKTGQTHVVGAQNTNLGGLLTGYDQVFVGIRWLP